LPIFDFRISTFRQGEAPMRKLGQRFLGFAGLMVLPVLPVFAQAATKSKKAQPGALPALDPARVAPSPGETGLSSQRRDRIGTAIQLVAMFMAQLHPTGGFNLDAKAITLPYQAVQ
jgi:hypothetical protein